MAASDHLLGRLVLKHGFASEAQLRQCIQRSPPGTSLLEALTRAGLVDEERRRVLERELAVAGFVRAERAFARVCAERGLLSEEQLRNLLENQRREGFRWRVGDVLLERGIISPETREAIAREQVRRLEEEDARFARTPASADGDDAIPLAGEDTAPHPSLLESVEEDRRRYGSGERPPLAAASA
ncbi:MAG: hypothetical protein D6731_07305, partial [Planctomycetota bacterium]